MRVIGVDRGNKRMWIQSMLVLGLLSQRGRSLRDVV